MYDFRLKYVKWLQKFIKVDIYGECGPLSCGSSRNMGNEYKLTSDPCFDLVNKNYRCYQTYASLEMFVDLLLDRFYLSFENAICKDYVTEKIFNALRLNTIPVVLGGANYSQILPPGSYINAGKFESPEHLANFLYSLLRNEELFDAYFAWRPFYDIHR